MKRNYKSLEICAGAGGQALGLEMAGFEHEALIEIDPAACTTLRLNRPNWKVVEGCVRSFSASQFRGIDLLAGGVPCPPFSHAGKQMGSLDERDLFPEALRLVDEARPRVVMLENVRGLLDPKFSSYREQLKSQFEKMGYRGEWKLLHASDFAVPQLRPRAIFVAAVPEVWDCFTWPTPKQTEANSVGNTLKDLMATNRWNGLDAWVKTASNIAPTVVGGSKKHGGPDLGPTRAKRAWAELGVDGMGIANEAPPSDFTGMPRLTVRMVARLQGFPDHWQFAGKKTASYRQVGNAFPPPVAHAVGLAILKALERAFREKRKTVGKQKPR